MIVGWVGRAFRAVAHVLRTADGADLDRVGVELLRLEARRAHRPTTSR